LVSQANEFNSQAIEINKVSQSDLKLCPFNKNVWKKILKKSMEQLCCSIARCADIWNILTACCVKGRCRHMQCCCGACLYQGHFFTLCSVINLLDYLLKPAVLLMAQLKK
jgi:hypothetical protein